jgi:hypothetical protein
MRHCEHRKASTFSGGGGMMVDVSDRERLDVLMRSVFGCTFIEFMTKIYQQGIKNGRRLEKGKSEWPKSHGRPPLLKNEILELQFIDSVDAQMNEKGISLFAAVTRYREVFGRAWKLETDAPPLLQLTSKQLQSLYKRKKKPGAISDDAHRAYNILQGFGSVDSPNT